MDRLWSEAEVADDGDTGLDEVADDVLVSVDALDLHCMGACAHEERGAFDGGDDAFARGEVGEVGDQKLRAGESAGDGGGVARHDFGGGGKGGRFTVHDGGDAVADEHAIDGRGGEELRLPLRVGGGHADTALALAGFEFEDGLHTRAMNVAGRNEKANSGVQAQPWRTSRGDLPVARRSQWVKCEAEEKPRS